VDTRWALVRIFWRGKRKMMFSRSSGVLMTVYDACEADVVSMIVALNASSSAAVPSRSFWLEPFFSCSRWLVSSLESHAMVGTRSLTEVSVASFLFASLSNAILMSPRREGLAVRSGMCVNVVEGIALSR
jgi:hypothetical protein